MVQQKKRRPNIEFRIAGRKAVAMPPGVPFRRLREFSRPLNMSAWELVNTLLNEEFDDISWFVLLMLCDV